MHLPRLQRSPLLRATLLLLAGAGCRDALPPTAPGGGRPVPRPLGVVEVTISGIGTARMTASARVPDLAALGTATPQGFATPDSATGGVQLQALSTGSFTVGSRPGGYRYVYARYRVRNAATNGVAYTTPRTNLTFFGVATGSTLGGTAVSQMARFDGSAITDPSVAAGIVPTGPAYQTERNVITGADVDALQVFSEADVAPIPLPSGVTTVFPYGFVTRNATSDATRTLPAAPAPGQYDGIVTFAFRVPLQASAADDPFSVSGMFLALDDDVTRITQSVEQQDSVDVLALRSRTESLGATLLTLLPGANYPPGPVGPLVTRFVCDVRAGGTAASPTSYIIDGGATLQSLSPAPNAASADAVARTTSFTATFDHAPNAPTGGNFPIVGSQGGRYFLGASYGGAGTTTITTPTGTFHAGEDVQLSLAGSLGTCGGLVYKYRAASAPASGTLTPTDTEPTLFTNVGIATLADVDGDGVLDVGAVENAFGGGKAAWWHGNGDGTIGAATYLAAGSDVARGIAATDLNGDGHTDLLVAYQPNASGPPYLRVLLGAGGGSFAHDTSFVLGTSEVHFMNVAVGDVNGDGRQDVVVGATTYGVTFSTELAVLVGHGDGTFDPPQILALGPDYVSDQANAQVALADANRDGALDVLVGTSDANGAPEVVVALGNGDGTFHAPTAYLVPFNPSVGTYSLSGFDVGDVNGDGIVDVVVAQRNAETWEALGNGDGTFGAFTDLGIIQIAGVRLADLNGDGVLDLLSPGGVRPGNGNGTFGSPSPNFLPAAFNPVFGDMNGDGKLDRVGFNSTNLVVAVSP